MKKVIGVAVAASLVAGMAFAEVSVYLNARLKSNMYHFIKKENGNKETYTFDLDGAKGHGGSGAMSDTLGFNAKTDYAGVTLELAPKSDDSAAAVDKKYNGWLKFGNLNFSFGTMDSRFISRYNTTMGESGLLDSDYAKYGLASLTKYDGTNKFLFDANNFTALEGTRVDTLIADYTFADVAGGKLLVKGELIENDYKTDTEDEDDKKWTKAGFGFEADYQNKSVAIQGLFKKVNEDQMILGAYVEPKGLPVNAVLGFTYGSEKDKIKSAFAIDGRVQYKADALTVAGLVKYESLEVDVDGAKTDTALAAGAEVSYVVNDKIGAFFDIMYINADLDDDDNGAINSANSKIQVRPGVKFTAGKGAAITAAFQYDSYNGKSEDRSKKTEYSIPVIFRVKL